jgi:hypothetical protein
MTATQKEGKTISLEEVSIPWDIDRHMGTRIPYAKLRLYVSTANTIVECHHFTAENANQCGLMPPTELSPLFSYKTHALARKHLSFLHVNKL